MDSSAALVVGSLAFDDLDMPTGEFRDVLGGAATYSSIAASFLSPVRLVGVIGKDFGEEHLDMLRARGVDTQGVERQANGKTFRWHGRYSKDLSSRESIDTQLNVFADFRPKIPASYKQSNVALLGNIHPKLQLEVLSQVERGPRTMVIADTMNFWISGEPKTLSEMLPKIDLFVINDEEARQLSGKANMSAVAREIRKMGPKRLIIKRGEHGAILFDDDGCFFVPGYPLEEVLDPTGAGDTFAGGFLGYLAGAPSFDDQTLRKAVVMGSTLASYSVEAFSLDRLLTLTRSEIDDRFRLFKRLTHFESI